MKQRWGEKEWQTEGREQTQWPHSALVTRFCESVCPTPPTALLPPTDSPCDTNRSRRGELNKVKGEDPSEIELTCRGGGGGRYLTLKDKTISL
jgi:hypothetical protein